MNYMTHTIEPWMPIGATKPKDDIASLAKQVGWQELLIDRASQSTDANNLAIDLTADDLVVHQFPSYLPLAFEENFQQAVKQTGATFILFIHDFEPLRIANRPTCDREYALVHQSDGLVVHTKEMADALVSPVPTFILGLFDYLTTAKIPERLFTPQLLYAGTLTKASWLKTCIQPISVFGKRPRKWQHNNLPPHITIHDLLPQDLAPGLLPDGIGLVWDSDSDHDTSYHRYQNINSPHKLSLYLAAELPVILPTFSPFFNFILDNQLGGCITDLSELPLTFSYDKIKAKQIGHDLRTGKHTKDVLKKLIAFYNK